MHCADVAVAAVSVAFTWWKRPTGFKACTERVVVGGMSTFAVRAAIATLDRWVTDTIISADFMTTTVRVRKTRFVLHTDNTDYVKPHVQVGCVEG